MCSWNTVNLLILKSTSVPLRQKAMNWWNRWSNNICVCVHSLTHSFNQTLADWSDWTLAVCQAMLGAWRYSGDYCTVLGVPSLARVDKEGGRGGRAEQTSWAKMGSHLRLFNPRRTHMFFQLTFYWVPKVWQCLRKVYKQQWTMGQNRTQGVTQL